MGSLIEWGAEVDCTIAVTLGTTLLPSDAPITPHLHPDRHVSLLKTLQDRDEASSAHDTAMDPITRRLTPLLKNSAQLLDRM